MSEANERRVVYVTGIGRVRQCSKCGQPKDACRCAYVRHSSPADATYPDDGFIRIARDKKGRKGKTMTVISGLPGTDAELAALAKSLKQLCAAGGALQGRTLELQGDHRERLAARLTELGFKIQRVGG